MAPAQLAGVLTATSSLPTDLTTRLGMLARDHGPTFCERAQFRAGAECHRELVHAGPDLEVWLLSWLPGQITPIHDHGGALTVTAVLAGALFEERFACVDPAALAVRPIWSAQRHVGDPDPIDPSEIHRVRPIGSAITLHLYAPTCLDGRIYQVAS